MKLKSQVKPFKASMEEMGARRYTKEEVRALNYEPAENYGTKEVVVGQSTVGVLNPDLDYEFNT
ncbi:MAG TPA: hypothetical protein DEA55_02330 [Rhodospirillaceae bacterium]|nr:hypothetical protein [Rhodospirillaceae bacterium]